MRAKPASLDQIERWMQSVLVHPGGVEEGVGSQEVRQYLDVTLDELESVIRRSQALSAAQRLEIYVDAYHERLMECLREEFPATRAAAGTTLFDALAFGYLERHPSRSYTLAQLGARLADFLAESRLHAHEAPPDAGPTWPDFVIDLVRFERTLREVFDAPGSEGLPPFEPGHFPQSGQVTSVDWGEVRLDLTPGLQLKRFGHDVYAYWRAVKDGQSPPAQPPRSVYLAIYRRDYVVVTHELLAPQFDLLLLVSRGATLLEAVTRVAQGASARLVASELRQWFAEWARLGFCANPTRE